MDFFEMNERVQSIDIDKIIEEAFFNNEAELIDILQENQLKRGLDGAGDKIGQYKDYGYADMKANMNPLPGYMNVDLKLTGDFYSGMALERSGSDFQVRSSDEKASRLEKKYGVWMYSLTNENAGEFAQDFLLADIQDGIREVLDV